MVCISRHAYDIAGMSTDRGWESCMTFTSDDYNFEPATDEDGKEYNRFLEKDIVNGTIIAYLIKASDKNLQNPIGRIALKPYLNKHKRILVVSSLTYGTTPDNFEEFVQDWAYENFNKGKWGEFKLNQKVYSADSSHYFTNKAKEKDLENMKFKYIPKNFAEFITFMEKNTKYSIKDFKKPYIENHADFRQLKITKKDIIDNPYDIKRFGYELFNVMGTSNTQDLQLLVRFIFYFTSRQRFVDAESKEDIKKFIEFENIKDIDVNDAWQIHQNMR
jgi:hypothetical protein